MPRYGIYREQVRFTIGSHRTALIQQHELLQGAFEIVAECTVGVGSLEVTPVGLDQVPLTDLD